MEQMINFIMQHLYLSIAAIALIVLLLIFEFQTKWLGIQRITAGELTLLINREGVVVDINEADVFHQGHILGTVHLPFSEWPQKLTNLDKYKSNDLIVISTHEQQSIQAAKMLKQRGFEKVAVLIRGLTAWREAGLPLVKK